MLAGGFDQSLTQRLSLQGSFGYVFNDDAEFGEFLGFDISEQIDAGWEIGLGIEYALDDQLLLSAGYLYIESGYNAQTLTVNRFTLDAPFVGAGLSGNGQSRHYIWLVWHALDPCTGRNARNPT